MKSIIVGMVFTVLMMAPTSYAEEKLFITDILEKKEVEIMAAFGYGHISTNFYFGPPAPVSGKTVDDYFWSRYTLNVGLGHGLQVGVSIPYLFSEKAKNRFYTAPVEDTRFDRDGFGDISLLAKYLIFSETEKPFTLVAGLSIKPETASEDDWGTGATSITPGIALSTTVAESIRPYAAYEPTFRNHGKSDTHLVELGVEKELNDRVGLNAFLQAIFSTSSDRISSYDAYGLGLNSYIQIYPDLYVIPEVHFLTEGSADRRDMNAHLHPSRITQVILRFYYLF